MAKMTWDEMTPVEQSVALNWLSQPINSDLIFEYEGDLFPQYLKEGNACQYVAPIARKFCVGKGYDVGANKWPLEGATPIDSLHGGDAMHLPEERADFVFSSHCLEHLPDPIGALLHWKSRIKPGGPLFMYLPHPDMHYWLPQNCRKHLHSWAPEQMARILRDLGFTNVIHSERDLAWSFACVGFNV